MVLTERLLQPLLTRSGWGSGLPAVSGCSRVTVQVDSADRSLLSLCLPLERNKRSGGEPDAKFLLQELSPQVCLAWVSEHSPFVLLLCQELWISGPVARGK